MSAVPLTLSDVVTNVIALLVGIGEADYPHVDGSGLVGIYVGERYLKQEGSPPRIVFVLGDGQSGGPLAVGARQVGSVTESVDCYVWGSQDTFDLNRRRDAETRWHRLFNAFKACAPGRLKSKSRNREGLTNVETFGDEFVWTVEYSYAIPEDAVVMAWAKANAPVPAQSPPNPDKPDGDTGAIFAPGTITLANSRPS